MLLWGRVRINPFTQNSFTWTAINTVTNNHQQCRKLKVYNQYPVTRQSTHFSSVLPHMENKDNF